MLEVPVLRDETLAPSMRIDAKLPLKSPAFNLRVRFKMS